MLLRALETSIEIARPITPITSSRAPAKLAEAQIRKPAKIKSAEGRTPKRKTAPPIAMLPVTWAPQRDLKRLEERFSVAKGPVPSSAITGTARKVIRDQPTASTRPTI